MVVRVADNCHIHSDSVTFVLQLISHNTFQKSVDDVFGGIESQEDSEFLSDLQSPCSTGQFGSAVPRHLSGLFFSPVIEANDENADPSDNSHADYVKRGLFRPPSAPIVAGNRPSGCLIRRRNSHKRLESERDASMDGVTMETKRHRAAVDVCDNAVRKIADNRIIPAKTDQQVSRRPFMRCHSETEIMIKSALHRADTHPDLIGDFTMSYCLPLVSNSKHPDLKSISAYTVCDVFVLLILLFRCMPDVVQKLDFLLCLTPLCR